MTADRGLKCPRCHCPMSDVVRTTKVLGKVRRRRVCGWCGAAYFTVETVAGVAATQKGAHMRQSDRDREDEDQDG
jgi:transcriptional regulator NrdR family protein